MQELVMLHVLPLSRQCRYSYGHLVPAQASNTANEVCLFPFIYNVVRLPNFLFLTVLTLLFFISRV